MSFVAAWSNKSTTTSVAVTVPAGTVQKGDIMVAFVNSYRSTSAAPGAIAFPTVTTAFVTATTRTTASYYILATSYKRCLGDENGSYSFTSTNATQMEAVIMVFRNRLYTGTPVGTISNTAYVTSNTTVEAAALTATALDDLCWGGWFYLASGTYTLSTPTSFTAPSGNSQANTANILSSFYRLAVSAGTTGVVDSTAGSTATVKHAYM